MKWICIGRPDLNVAIAEWARRKIGLRYGWRECTTLSLWDDVEIRAAVIYENFSGNNISMHVASDGARWLTRRFLHAAFFYPFLELKVDRVTGCVPDSNEASKRFCEHLGFKREGVIRRGADDGGDLILFGMLRDECRFLEVVNGKTQRPDAA